MRFITALLVATWIFSSSLTAQEPKHSVQVLVPAYFYPAGAGLKAWETLLDSGKKAPIIAIVNPASGPGKQVDPNYMKIMERAKTSKVTLVGYVTLGYAKRPAADVKAEVDTWLRFYPGIQGIFFDEQPSSADQVAFANECFTYARDKFKKAHLFSNPGTVCAKEYLQAEGKTSFCLFENDKGFEKFQLPDWAKKYSPDRFTVLLYDIGSSKQMEKAYASALRQHFGVIYITDAKGANPWDRLPSYWDEFLAVVAKHNPKAKNK